MYHTIDEFLQEWEVESSLTLKILNSLTDESLTKPIPGYRRTAGRLAWHVTGAPGEMLKTAGYPIDAVIDTDELPGEAAKISQEYEKASSNLVEKIKSAWTDETLKTKINMYGDMWTGDFILRVLIAHQIHHRAQLTVLMRLAGLSVPGVYGPSYEEWKQLGMEALA